MSMTSRERVRAVLDGRIPDRLPFNFWMDRDRMAQLDAKWGQDFRVTHYGADVVEAFATLPFWAGLPRKTVSDHMTTWQVAPLISSVEEALRLPLPDPTDPSLLADIRAKRAAYPDRAIFALFIAPLDILQPLWLAEGLYTALYDSPATIHELLRRIEPILVECARRVCTEDIDALYLAGDVCGRDGPLVSPRHLREFNFNYLRRVIHLAHASGKKVLYHTDGRVLPLIELFLEYSIDGINPLEPRFNDPEEFLRRSNCRLILYGGGDNCDAIPNGTPDTVRDHVLSRFRVFGRNGMYIFSTHDIPSYCPLANLDAMVAAIKECSYAEGGQSA
jgi:uroporphyrinogen decarboxylase